MSPVNYTKASFVLTLIFILLQWHIADIEAGSITLNNNSGTSSDVFFIEGESTLVMNGFDLNALNLTNGVVMDVVTIAVQQTVDTPLQVVIYEDSNGGSPNDATLVYQTQVTIQTAGTAFITLPEPVTINAPVVWVGFYLPSGFRFFADDSGSSVLTYWAWTPGGTFDLSNLGSAQVLGAANGTEPVNIDQGGVARITAEVSPFNAAGLTGDGTNNNGVDVGTQIAGGDADLSVMSVYPYCGDQLLYDGQDVNVSGQRRFTTHCRADLGAFSPGTFINADDLPASVPSYERRGFFYEVFVNGNTAANSSEEMLVPVTHCLRPQQAEVPSAVIGVAYGAPREWAILPTVRYGDWVCAEVTHAGFLSYFVPRAGDEPTLNADLYFVSTPYLFGEQFNTGEGLLCKYPYTVHYNIRNEGFVATPQAIVRAQLSNIRTGTVTQTADYLLPPIAPGDTMDFAQMGFIMPDTFINEATRFRLIIDPNNAISELNETNNVFDISGNPLLITNRCR